MAKSEAIEMMFGIKLYPYQKAWVNDDSQFRIVNKSRQVGFSWCCAAEALFSSMFIKNSTILFVSTSQKGANRIMKYVRDLWYKIPEEIRKEFAIESFTKEEIEFTNGSKIISLPNNPDSARGYPATDVYLDEFAFLENEQKMWEAILPTTSRKDVRRRMSLMSTPFGKLNTFYNIYEKLKGKKEDVWSRHKVMWYDCPDIDITKIKCTMTENQFKQEYNCQFIDEVSAVFTYELLNACTPGRNEIEKEAIKPELSITNKHSDGTGQDRVIYAGVDFGKVRDATVITFFEKKFIDGDTEPHYKMLRMEILERMNYMDQIPLILKYLREMCVDQVYVDQTGVGEKLYEDLANKDLPIYGVKFSNSWKEKAVTRMILLMTSGRVRFLNDEKLIEQFHDLQKIITKNNNVRYEHSAGGHDDIYWSCNLALNSEESEFGYDGVVGGTAW